jgi:hypothetical protein
MLIEDQYGVGDQITTLEIEGVVERSAFASQRSATKMACFGMYEMAKY